MTTTQIINAMENIRKDYIGMGRADSDDIKKNDALILNTIIRIYNYNDYLDFEEIKWLWTQYMETGNLCFSDAVEMARLRVERECKVNKINHNVYSSFIN